MSVKRTLGWNGVARGAAKFSKLASQSALKQKSGTERKVGYAAAVGALLFPAPK